MKKVLSVFIIVLIYFFALGIDVKAHSYGATKDDLDNNLNTENHVIIDSDDFACIFKNQNNLLYIVIKFTKSDNVFKLNDVTHELTTNFNFNGFFVEDSETNSYIQFDKFDTSFIKTKEDIKEFCNDRHIRYDANTPIIYFNLDEDKGVGNKYEYDDELSSKASSGNLEVENVTCTKDGMGTGTLMQDGNHNWYLSNENGEKICFASPENSTNAFIVQGYSNDPDFNKKFDCSNYNLAKNINIDDCKYLLYEVRYDDNVTQDIVIDDSGGITKYVLYSNSHDQFVVYEENGEIVLANSSERINVANIDNYKSIFQNKENDKYPKYLFLSGSTYTFDDKKPDSVNKAYINVEYLHKITNLLDQEEEYTTCEDLFGDSFLTFMDNYIFTVIRIGVAILLIVLTTFDFAKVVFVDDKEGIQKAFNNFKIRAIAAVLIFLTPTILIIIANLIGAPDSVSDCMKTIRNMGEVISSEVDN